MVGDVFDHLVALEWPLPGPGQVDPPEMYDELRNDALREQHERAQDLRTAWEEHWQHYNGSGDPVLDAIADARQAMLRAEQHMRLLLAYGKEFVRPRGYTLAQLAEHAGMSISGVRTAYDLEDEGRIVAERTGLQPRPRSSGAGE